MILRSAAVVLEPISPALARRIVARDEQPGDDWHAEYPFEDELAPLHSLTDSADPDPDFTMYLVRRTSDGRAVGGLGFFGPPDEAGAVELGYGLVASARGEGLATDAVGLALEHARRRGATRAVADADEGNLASRRVLVKNGFTESGRRGALVLYERELTADPR